MALLRQSLKETTATVEKNTVDIALLRRRMTEITATTEKNAETITILREKLATCRGSVTETPALNQESTRCATSTSFCDGQKAYTRLRGSSEHPSIVLISSPPTALAPRVEEGVDRSNRYECVCLTVARRRPTRYDGPPAPPD